jgi:hypothetical protein
MVSSLPAWLGGLDLFDNFAAAPAKDNWRKRYLAVPGFDLLRPD